MGKPLQNFCMNKDEGGLVAQAIKCTNADLVHKSNISVHASNVVFLRLVRVKMPNEHDCQLNASIDCHRRRLKTAVFHVPSLGYTQDVHKIVKKKERVCKVPVA
ncbi:hypothetical protein PHMEG_0008486 [Phytophthora megakarya]|uniref:Uncharacterized protein n=1 Tax=Phytophthora megakarya TaxID=4795 RepID=A0A225WIM4_9STRA|nr:hypothetical protein PHMEG_0008486 [Phytophthora megakarya]